MVSESNKRIARNTVLLYIRTLFSQLIALYTSRKILEILGVEDYGIYNVVGGVVGMLTFLNSSMAVATQRFLTIELGRNDLKAFGRVFSMSFIIHIALALIIVIAAETVGLWFLNTQLNIPADRMTAANWVYQVSVLSMAIGIIQVPYEASVTAYEHFDLFAYVGMGEYFLRLVIVFLLLVISYDHLIVYGLLSLGVSLLSAIIIRIYAMRTIVECHFRWKWDGSLFRSMLDFTGWNLFGTIAWLLKGQGSNILMNIFGGPAINAARGVSYQVSNAIENLVRGFSTAVNPQLTKNYASGNREGLFRLMMTSSKISFFLLLVIALPVMIEISYILRLWLVEVPAYAALFTQLVLLEALLNTYGGPMMTGLIATGKIRYYQIVVSSVLLLILPISYVFLHLGYSIATPLIVSIVAVVLSTGLRLWFCKRQLELPMRRYIYKVICPTIGVFLCSSIAPVFISRVMEIGFLRLLSVTLTSILSVSLLTYRFGLNHSERMLVCTVTNKVFHKVFK